MRLSMANRYDVLSVSLHIVQFYVFTSSLIEVISQIHVLIGDRCCICPHCVSQSHRRALTWSTIKCQQMLVVLQIKKEYSCNVIRWGLDKSYRFMAARYRNLWIMGKEGWILSKYI